MLVGEWLVPIACQSWIAMKSTITGNLSTILSMERKCTTFPIVAYFTA